MIEEQQRMEGICPFRAGHYCIKCQWYNKKVGDCTVILINSSLGRIIERLDKMEGKGKKKVKE